MAQGFAGATPAKITDGTTVASVTGSNALKVDNSAVTQPVSGTVTANLAAGTNNIGDVDVLSVPAPLSTTGGGTEATALRVTIASDSSGVVSVDDNGSSLTVDGTVSVAAESLSPTAVTASSSGDNTIYTPTGGQSARVHYLALSADGGNSADVTAIVKFGAGGASKYKVSLKAGAIFARNIGAGKRYMQGGIDEAVIVNLSAAQTVHVSVEAESV